MNSAHSEALRVILEQILSEIDQLAVTSLDLTMPVIEGVRPDSMDCDACHTGEHEYTLRWRYIDAQQAAKFKEFMKSHIPAEYL